MRTSFLMPLPGILQEFQTQMTSALYFRPNVIKCVFLTAAPCPLQANKDTHRTVKMHISYFKIVKILFNYPKLPMHVQFWMI